jgi:dihydroorotase
MDLTRRDLLKGAAVSAAGVVLSAGASSALAQSRGEAQSQGAGGARYDLLLKGGKFIDPASGKSGMFDVAFRGDKVAAIEANINPGLAKQVQSVAGAMVVPGVIDMHVHAVDGLGESANPDEIGIKRGVTTVADGGTCGAGNFGVFRYVAAANKTRLLAWLNLSTIGQTDLRAGELILGQLMIVEDMVRIAKKNPDTIVGLKARLSTYVTGGASAFWPIKLLQEASMQTNLPIMVHVGDTRETLGEILDKLRPGDICTHYLTSRKHGVLGVQAAPGGKLIPQIIEARKRGVILDVARGRNHAGFPQMQATVEAGLLPDTISTDLTHPSSADRYYSPMMIATQLMSFGAPFEECLKQMTVNPARIINRPELGKLEVGGVGDATLLKFEEGNFTLRDTDGRTRQTNKRLVSVGCVRAGSFTGLTPPPAA